MLAGYILYTTRDIPNKVCIVVVHNLILNCIFGINLIHLQQCKNTLKRLLQEFKLACAWKYCSWLRSVLSRAFKICSPSRVESSLMRRFRLHHETKNDANEITESNITTLTLWFKMCYIGQKGEQLLHGLTKKLKRHHTISNIRIVTRTTIT